uniref:Uncharacterized protein n=1 Tax=Anguilla anguilla TaxID=7936 RepID=A0A0E9X930_ANGAN
MIMNTLINILSSTLFKWLHGHMFYYPLFFFKINNPLVRLHPHTVVFKGSLIYLQKLHLHCGTFICMLDISTLSLTKEPWS